MKATTLTRIITITKGCFSVVKKQKKGQKKIEIYFSNQNFKQNDEFLKKNSKKTKKNPIPVKIVSV